MNNSDDNDRNIVIDKLALALQEIKPYKNHDNAYNTAKRLMNEMNSEKEIRKDKVNLARQRIKSRFYFKREVLSKIADNILKEFGLD